jgi:S1-C subfamily serine protease
LAAGPSPGVASAIHDSAILRAVDRVAPPTPNVLAVLRKFLDTSGFPEVLSGINPRFAPPVPPPDPSIIQSEGARVASGSTVKVLGEACGVIQEGSGWVAAPGLVVTNAHVVSGVKDVRVLPPGEDNLQATTLVFDPDRDLAVLQVGDMRAPPLEMVAQKPERGAPGIVLGYPENTERVEVVPAAIRAELRAVGRDIYSERQVERDVFVVQATVRPGNSGGPLVDPDGRVMGVIFAAAIGEDNTGYALTDDEVRPVLDQAAAGAQPVGTGSCRE